LNPEDQSNKKKTEREGGKKGGRCIKGKKICKKGPQETVGKDRSTEGRLGDDITQKHRKIHTGAAKKGKKEAVSAT